MYIILCCGVVLFDVVLHCIVFNDIVCYFMFIVLSIMFCWCCAMLYCSVFLWMLYLYFVMYNGTSHKQPPLMSGLGGCLWEVVTYRKIH